MPVFRTIDHRMPCTNGSNPSIPNKAWGRSHVMPQGPISMTDWLMTAPTPKLGRNSVQVQMTNPVNNPHAAPTRVAPLQKIPPIKAGSTCTVPVNDTKPIAAKAVPPPDIR